MFSVCFTYHNYFRASSKRLYSLKVSETSVVPFCLIFSVIAPCFSKLIFLQGGERSLLPQFISWRLES